MTRWNASRMSTNPRCWWSARALTRASSISRGWRKSRSRWEPCFLWTWRTLPAWWPPASTPARCRTPTSFPLLRTKRCVGRAAAWCFAARNTPRNSTASPFPARRAGRWCTPSPHGSPRCSRISKMRPSGSASAPRSLNWPRDSRSTRSVARGRTARPTASRHITPVPDARRPMRVAIDIRRAGDFGIGTYVRNIVNQLARQDSATRYLLIGQRQHVEEFDPLPENFDLLDYPAEPGTFRTHLHLPMILRQRRVDLLHMPWFYAPAVLPCRLVITAHDLTDVVSRPLASTP